MSNQDHTTFIGYREIARLPGYRFGDDGSIWNRWGRRSYAKERKPAGQWFRLSPSTKKEGYQVVVIHGKNYRVCRLTLEAFVGRLCLACEPKAEAEAKVRRRT